MTLRMRVLPRFPAAISATNGLKVTRPEGTPNLVVEPDFGALVQIPSVDNPDDVFFWAWDRILGLYRRMSFADLFEGVADLGFMQESVYDPQNIHADAFARANHTGTQAIATVSGLQAALDAKLALAGGVMTGAIQDLSFAPSSAPTKKGTFDLALVTAGQTRSIKVPDMDVALSKWEAIRADGLLTGISAYNVTGLSAFKKLRITGFIYPSTATTIGLRSSSNNGSSYDSGASDYAYQLFGIQGNGSPSGVNSAGTIVPISTSANVAATLNDGIQVHIEIDQLNVAGYMKVNSQSFGVNVSGGFISLCGAHRAQATARDAFQIIGAAGTLSTNLVVEGIRG